MDYKAWLKAAGIRALKTAGQAAIAVIGSSGAMGEVNWPLVGSSALLAAILSVLTSVVGIPEVSDGASLAAGIRADKAAGTDGEE